MPYSSCLTNQAHYYLSTRNVTPSSTNINPAIHRAAYHTDWSAHLPFADLGLGDNYSRPPASVALFGFSVDPSLVSEGSPRLRQALLLTENQIQQEAVARGLTVERYRELLHQHFNESNRALAAASRP